MYSDDGVGEDAFELLCRKGVYPYEYMDSFNKFNETKLPDKDKYYSILNRKGISDDEYNFAKKMWETLKIKNLGQLHDIYMNTDVMLLADVFESFRTTAMKTYELDPAHFLTAPSLSWAACLRKTRVKLELLTDPDMNIFINKSLIGGMSGVFIPIARANNPQMGKKYDSNKPLRTILYFDACNLYGWSMGQYLPIGGFMWVEVSEREDWAEFILNLKDEQDVGYMFEVDLEYPEHLHDLHDAYPLAPEKIKIKEEYLSEYQKELGRGCGVKFGAEKLCVTLNDKERYTLHYRNLKQYLELGMKLKKVHKVLKFNQSP